MRPWISVLAITLLSYASAAYAEESIKPQNVADRESIASSVVNHTVNVITGNYGDSTVDAVMPGVENLVFSRVHSSVGNQKSILGRAWHFNHHQLCQYGSSFKGSSAYITEKSGAGMVYHGRCLMESRPEVTLQVDPTRKACNGLTNTGYGTISASNNLKNTRVELNAKRNRVQVTDSGGGKRYFKRGGAQHLALTCREETLPNGNRLLYDTEHLTLTGIHLVNHDGSAQLASAQIIEPKFFIKEKVIELSDGRSIRAHFTKDNKLDYVIRPLGPDVIYRYDSSHRASDRVTRREYPDGRYLCTQYYRSGTNVVGGRVIKVSPSKSLTSPTRRVMFQEEPSAYDERPIQTYKFFYHLEQSKDPDRPGKKRAKGFTEVRDAYDYRTDYYHDFTKRLTAIYKYNADEELVSRERLVWGDIKGPDATNLIASVLEDGKGQAIFAKTFTYDARGNAIKETNWGNLSGEGQVPLILDEQGMPVDNGCENYAIYREYGEDQYNLLLKEKEPSGKEIQYAYKDNSNLLVKKTTWADGVICERQFFAYDENAACTREVIDDGAGEAEEDLQGVTRRRIKVIRPRSQAPALGLPEEVEEYYLDTESGQEKLLRRIAYVYSPWGDVDEQILHDANGEECYRVQSKHNEKGQITLRTDPLGRRTHYSYDANGNLLRENPEYLNYVIHHSYDYMNRCIRSEKHFSDGQIFAVKKRYNLRGECTVELDEFHNATEYRYDALGRVIEKALPETADGEAREFYSYDVAGNVVAVTDPNGYRTEKSYNARRQVTQIRYPDGSQEILRYTPEGWLAEKQAVNGVRTRYHYDSLGQATCIEEWSACGELLTQKHQIYEGKTLVKTIDAEGGETDHCYDGAGRKIAEVHRRPQGDACTYIEYDTLGRPYKMVEPYGDAPDEVTVTLKKYDVLDRVIEEEIQDSQGQTLKWHAIEYDALGKETRRITKDTDGKELSSWKVYDSLGQLIEVIDPEGNSTHIDYDRNYRNALGQKVLRTVKTDPLGLQEESIYNARGQVEEVIRRNPYGQKLGEAQMRYDANGQRILLRTAVIAGTDLVERWEDVQWDYDSRGRLTKLTEGTHNPRRTLTFYNANGQKSLVIKPDQVQLRYFYDKKGRIQNLSSSDGSINYEYAYNRRDQLHRVVNYKNGEIVERGYDTLGWLVAEKIGDNGIMRYQHDRRGRRTYTQLPNKTGIAYVYDAAYLRGIARMPDEDKAGYAQAYTHYDSSGQLLQAELPLNRGILSIRRDKMGRPKRIQTAFWEESIPEGGYNAVGNLTALQVADSEGVYNNTYSYNDRHQLKAETGHSPHRYAHDSIGNRLEKDGRSHRIQALNQLTHDGELDYSYDANGNMREVSKKGQTICQYHYDALDRLTEVVYPAEKKLEFTYDAFHRRLHKRVYAWKDQRWRLTKDEGYLYEGQNEIASVQGEKIRELRILGEGLGAELGAAIAMEIDGKVLLPIHDHRGNVTAVVDPEQGKAVATYRYSAYGEESVYGDCPNPWRFSSKRVDDETGLVYFGRRYYQPSIGRWISTDPKGYDEGPNLYCYVNNQPLSHWDLYGLEAQRHRQPTLMERISSGVRDGARATGQLLKGVAKHGMPPCPGREILEKIGQALNGENPLKAESSFYGARQVSGVVGSRVPNCGGRDVLITGMGNSAATAMRMCMDLSKALSERQIHYFVDESGGTTSDLMGSALQRVNLQQGAAKGLAVYITSQLAEMKEQGDQGNLRLHAHSRGTLHEKAALGMLTPEQRAKIEVNNYGGAVMLPNGDLAACVNYVAWRDPVSAFVGRCASYYNRSDYNIQYVGPKGLPMSDHTLLGPSYGPVIHEVMRRLD